MSRKANPTWIGAFVLGAVALAVAAVLILGSGRLFTERQTYILYFDDAVTGLSVGAPVIYQGVQIGTVTSVNAVIDFERDAVEVPVTIELVGGRVQVRGASVGGGRAVQREIERGLRARLKSQSLITGQLYVDLDYHPDKPAEFKHIAPEPPEIPTIPTELAELRRTFESLVQRVQALPLEDLVGSITSATEGVDRLVNKPELGDAIDQLDGTLAELRRTAATLRKEVGPIGESTRAMVEDARGAIERLDVALEDLDATLTDARTLVQPGSPVQYQLLSTLGELEQAARSVRGLADELSSQPDSILFGKGAENGR
jgi:paraquat-inducible protein B